MRDVPIIASCAFAAALSAAVAGAAPAGPARIGWDDLRQAGGGGAAAGPGNATTIELAGYLLPVDRDGDLVYEFLLVPRAGACSHAAQPPPDQVVHVVPRTPYRATGSYEPVLVTGLLRAGNERTQLFIMDGVAVVESGWSLARAAVVAAPATGDLPARAGNPWRFLRR